MIELNQQQKKQLGDIGEKFNLRFIILHGSYAKGAPHKGSDLDIAVVGQRVISSDDLLALYGGFGEIFGDNRERGLDIKSLHRTDPLFRYYVVRDGVLLYGDKTDFNEFRAYAERSFEDAKGLFELEAVLVKKQNELLLKSFAHA